MTLLRTDRALLEAFRAGDRDALTRVYWHYVDRVALVVRQGVVLSSGQRVGAVPAHEVSDLVQETFLRAFAEKARLAYDGLRDYRPFLLTICRNLVIDWARRHGRELPAPAELASNEAADLKTADNELPWADAATVAAVERFVDALKPPERDVYEARFVLGLSQADAATRLQVGRQTIRTVEKRLRAALASSLAAQGL